MSATPEVTAIIPRTVAETKALSIDLSKSQLLPFALRKKPEDVFAIVMTGQELGMAPMTALRAIHIIEGKPSLSADAMGALVMKSPACDYLTLVESTDKVATYRAKRRGSPGETTMSFTIEEAKRAGLLSKGNWAKYPAAMLRARCLAAICRAVFPDVCLGIYEETSEELERSTPANSDGQIADSQKTHVAAVADALKSQVAPTPEPKEDIVDAEFCEEPAQPRTLFERIAAAESVEGLKGLGPDLQAHVKAHPIDREALLAAYGARKDQLEGK